MAATTATQDPSWFRPALYGGGAMLVLSLVACEPEPSDHGEANPCEDPGTICTFAGTPEIASIGEDGVPATESGIYLPFAAAAGPGHEVVFVDWNNQRVRRVGPDGIVTTVAGTGFVGNAGEGPASSSALNHPADVVFDPNRSHGVWVSDSLNGQIVRIDMEADTLAIELALGVTSRPGRLAVDGGDLYFVDVGHAVVRRLRDGEVTDVAGIPDLPGTGGDGGPALDAQIQCDLLEPDCGIAIRGSELFLTDRNAGVIRVIDLEAGTIDRFAGTGVHGAAGDGGDAADAQFDAPTDIAVGPVGALYVADHVASCIRKIEVDGQISTFAGACGTAGYGGDQGPATDAILNDPIAVDVGPDGTVYVSDTLNQIVRSVITGG